MIVRMTLLSGLLFAAHCVSATVQGDVNGDGVLNVSDRVFLAGVLSGRSVAGSAADVDGDGRMGPRDAEALADLLLGQAPFMSVGSATIPADGSAAVVGHLGLSSSDAASFAGTTIDVYSADRDFGYDVSLCSEAYRLDGIPYRESASLTVSFPVVPSDRSTGMTMILVGEEVIAHSGQSYDIVTRLIPAASVDGRWLAELPICAGPPPAREDDLPSTYRLFVQRVSGVFRESIPVSVDPEKRAGIMLDLTGPATMTAAQKSRVTTALGNAAHIISGLGFDVHKRTEPVKIEVKDLGKGTCGLYQPSMVSLNWTSIDIDDDLVTSAARSATLRQTVMHEYFHMIQAWYDPRSAFVQAKYNAPQLWIDEGTAVWIEQFASGGTTSDYMKVNAGEVMKGLHVDCEGLSWTNGAAHTRAQNHGYGMSLMFQYLFASGVHQPNPTLITIYNGLAGGKHSEQAFLDAVSDPTLWWDNMLAAYVQGDIGIPPISFGSTRRNSAGAIRFQEDHVVSKPVQRTLMRHDRYQSSSVLVNWRRQTPPDDCDRRLVAELVAADDKFHIRAFQQVPGRNDPCVPRSVGMSLGWSGGRHVTMLTDEMTMNDGGGTQLPGHYLLVRRLVDSAADAVKPVLNVWYVDTRVPVQFTQGSLAKRQYTVSGHIDCAQIVYTDIATVGNGCPEIRVEPNGTIHLPVSLTLKATAAADSFYDTLHYTVQVKHIPPEGEGTSETLGVMPYSDTVTQNFTVTLREEDVGLAILVLAEEDLRPSAPSGIYVLGTNMFIGLVNRYDYVMGLNP